MVILVTMDTGTMGMADTTDIPMDTDTTDTANEQFRTNQIANSDLENCHQ